MTGLLHRTGNLLVRPRQEWKAIDQDQATDREIVGNVAVMAALPPLVAVLERLISGGTAAGSQPLGYVLAANAAWYLLILINMAFTAAVITVVVTPRERRWITRCGLQLACYSFIPLFLAGVLVLIPHMSWLLYPAILYSLTLLYLGIRTTMQMAPGRAAACAVGSFLAAGAIVVLLSGAEYLLESYVATKLFL